jgi:parallel beta-helix repeat protein
MISSDIGNYLTNVKTWGGLVYNVKDYGAKGNGKTNDTSAIQKAVDAASSAGGGEVRIPAGIYMIQGATGGVTYEGQGGGIKIPSNIHLVLDESAILRQIPTEYSNYNIIYFSRAMNSSITGGIIQGERYEHLGVGGEFGYAIGVFSCENITIESVTCKDCWGDGIVWQVDKDVRNDPSIPIREKQNKNITMNNVTCDNNRRQGASIESVLVGSITNSRFNNTSGTAPACGIDIEPFTAEKITEDLKIIGNHFENNDQFGLLILNQTTQRIVVEGNTFKDNKSLEGQIGAKNTSKLTISNNIFSDGVGRGIKLTLTNDCTLSGNRIREGAIILSGCKDILCDGNSVIYDTRLNVNFVVTEANSSIDCQDIQILNNTFGYETNPLTTNGMDIAGKNILINNNRISGALAALSSSGIGTYFEFKNNYVIDMSIQGINVADGSKAEIDNNTFSGIGWNNNGQAIIRVRDNAVANINNNAFYKDRIGGGDLGTGRPTSYFRIEVNGIVNAFNNFVDSLVLNNLGTLSTVIPRIRYRMGTTAQRPTTVIAGDFYYDTTLGKPIWYNGTVWKDAAGTTV